MKRLRNVDYVLFLELGAGEQITSDLMISGNPLTTYVARRGFANHLDPEIRLIGQRTYVAVFAQFVAFIVFVIGLFVAGNAS